MKKTYHIRPNSPAAYIVKALPFVAFIAVVIGCGILNTWDLGLF